MKLAFIISQPRSGSSLLQQILSSNSNIFSVPEPWFLLPLIYIYKKNISSVNIVSDFNYQFYQKNFNTFLNYVYSKTPDFSIEKQIQKLAYELYYMSFNQAEGNPTYFLDKTPRYYHIVSDILSLFPDAKVILLVRNPLSVFSSILDYNFKGNISFLSQKDRQDDLFKAPLNILNVKGKKNTIFVKYEDIINQPAITLKNIYNFLEINEYNENGNYLLDETFQKAFNIDNKSVKKHNQPSSKYINSWKESINNSQKKQLALEYINTLGKDVVLELGYDYDKIITQIKEHKVRKSFSLISFNHINSPDFSFKNTLKSFHKRILFSIYNKTTKKW
ncbi:MAG: sulfotransferase [Chitinophagales bacterium]|nr:sulfotransferase [Chitinophagales bacterium]